MANPPEAPTVTGLLRATIRTFGRSWRVIVPVCALLSVPSLAVQIGLASYAAVTAALRWGPQLVPLLLVLSPAIVAGPMSWMWYVWPAVDALVVFPLMITAYVLLYLEVRRRLEHAGVEPTGVVGVLARASP